MLEQSNFEKLEIWQLAVQLSVDIYKLTAHFPKNEMYSLTDQVKRSSTSIAANIAESSGKYHFKDKINFLYYSRGSLLETKSHLLLAQRLFEIDSKLTEPIIEDVNILAIKLNNFIKYLSKQQ
jgi:four helix bundle protein